MIKRLVLGTLGMVALGMCLSANSCQQDVAAVCAWVPTVEAGVGAALTIAAPEDLAPAQVAFDLLQNTCLAPPTTAVAASTTVLNAMVTVQGFLSKYAAATKTTNVVVYDKIEKSLKIIEHLKGRYPILP